MMGGAQLMITGAGIIGATEGLWTPAGILAMGFGAGLFGYGVLQVWDGIDDPWSVKPNRFLYD